MRTEAEIRKVIEKVVDYRKSDHWSGTGAHSNIVWTETVLRWVLGENDDLTPCEGRDACEPS
jgi:hypothetical protein